MFLILVFVLLVGNVIQLALIRSLQEDRNRFNTYISNNERLWSKQTTFNREYYHGKKQFRRADAEWPLPRTGRN